MLSLKNRANLVMNTNQWYVSTQFYAKYTSSCVSILCLRQMRAATLYFRNASLSEKHISCQKVCTNSDMKKQITLLFLLFVLPFMAMATHNRAGEIRVEQIGGCNSLKLRATIYTWTKASNTAVDRDTLDLCWGDGFCEKVVRRNGGGNGVVLPNDIKFNEYVSEHTFSGPGTYSISMTDPNRIVGILNVNPPQSDAVPFHIETIYRFQDPQFGGCNSTPILYQPPVDDACVGKPFRHNPNAWDPDDDSLSYHLYVPLQGLGTPVPNYFSPTQISPGPNNSLFIDPRSGDLLWQSPQAQGEYNIAIIIVSWRNGQPIDTTIRDMQIAVEVCENNPPEITTINEICVVAGDTVRFTATATDPDYFNPDSLDRVRLTVLGGPLSLSSGAATWSGNMNFNIPPVSGVFEWATRCEHITDNAYTVVFKAEDDADVSLVDLHSVSIKVVGPPPLLVQAQAITTDQIKITWEHPYICQDAPNDYFYGFSVWRREGPNPFTPDTCTPGLVGRGYQQVKTLTRDVVDGKYTWLDQTAEPGKTYCYRVLAQFARISAGGYRYNVVESLPSNEACVQLPRSLPMITHVSVTNTDAAVGTILLRWSKPIALDLDTVLNPPPYRYRVFRQVGNTLADPLTGQLIFDQTYNALWQGDTMLNDLNLNTTDNQYVYSIEFSSNGQVVGFAPAASSVYLRVSSTDKLNRLSWQASVPWQNQEYTVFLKEPGQPQFDSLTTVATPAFIHIGLENGLEYCYYIRAKGSYGIINIADPLINLSQQACGVPIDTLPPCAPKLTLTNICTDETLPSEPPFFNYLSWTRPSTSCSNDDTESFKVYFLTDSLATPILLETIDASVVTTTYKHEATVTLAACYYVTALDSLNNESLPSNLVCAETCPLYQLPNVFTPNGDGSNDVFKPFPGWRFVSRIELQIFNQWGNAVYTTQDPAINWDGKDMQGRKMSSGTYFYVCKAFAQSLMGEVELPGVFNGYIELIEGR
jgi:gliding motility-associated-like protein